MKDIGRVDGKIKSKSFFDPQFYLPNSQKKKLNTYPFFPEVIANGFSTGDFSMVALEAAKLCVDFQLEQGFRYVVIPARFHDQMLTDFTSRQDAYTVHPFLKALRQRGGKVPVLLTLPLTAHMVMDTGFRVDLLNWATSFSEVSGVYVFVASPAGTKQIISDGFLTAFMTFLRQLRKAGLEVIVGYCNTESVLYSMIDGCDVTFGTFENTRMFSIDKFVVLDEDRRGPKARIFLDGLLNWIQFNNAKEIREGDSALWNMLYTKTLYAESAFRAATEPTFNQPGLYKHHFLTLEKILRSLRVLSPMERYADLLGRLKSARGHYSKIEDMPVDLERHGRGAHVDPWLSALNSYYRTYLKDKS